MLDKKDLIAVRDASPADRNFVLATWLRGLRYGNDWYGAVESQTYFSVYHKVIEAILAKPTCVVRVACLKEDPEVILAYAVYEGDRLHWVFCKKPWRGIGIAKTLIPADTKVFTHLTKAGLSIMRKLPGVVFNPFFF